LSAVPVLEVVQTEGALWVRLPVSASRCSTSDLASAIAETCRGVEERSQPPACVVFASTNHAFFLPTPPSSVDSDVVGEGWRVATAAVARLSAPTVAVIAGDALGPAWELALACDLRIASTAARMGSPEIRWGRMPSAGGTQRLVRIAGPTIATRLLLLGEVISAIEALELGLIHRMATLGELEICARDLITQISAAAPIALAYTKEAVRDGVELSLADGLRLEADLASLLQTTGDRAEGIDAFLNRRQPRFQGE